MRNDLARRYVGGLKGVVLDWAGTTVDFGSRAPVLAFRAVLAAEGLLVGDDEVRAHMGLHKREHLRRILAAPRVAAAWAERHGHEATPAEVDALFGRFVPAQMEVLRETARPIPGVLEAIASLRARGIRIGSTTGYTREMLDRVADEAARLGYRPNARISVSEVPSGRPAPWMMHRVMELLDLHPPAAVVKIGDTPADVGEGLAAGCWTVALATTGNEVGLSQEEWEALAPEARESRALAARVRLAATGAHYVVDDWSGVLAVVEDIDARVRAGEAP